MGLCLLFTLTSFQNCSHNIPRSLPGPELLSHSLGITLKAALLTWPSQSPLCVDIYRRGVRLPMLQRCR
ncbi:rCG61736 [Rattus norvegicus]|uniref:RCG61736 n=1 Tax=Rattus norvegicus TaxID=10116 RepID=A6H9K2_RAT|nr:rCG61736 [Rattus norvegicus]